VARFAGDYSGSCGACGEHVEFAVGIRPGTDPVALHFGPSGPAPIEIADLELKTMIDDALDVRLSFICPLCGQRSPGRITCRPTAPAPRPED